MDLRFDQLYNTNSKLVVSPSKKIDTNFALYQGTYQDNYCTLEQIGSGAFGCVKNGFRRSDKKMVNIYIFSMEDKTSSVYSRKEKCHD